MAVPDASARRNAFRHQPPRLGDGIVMRSRLVQAMQGRFDRRLTTVTASAGFGKSTLLAQAILENEAEPRGIDAWLRVEAADRSPEHLLDGLARSVAGVARRGGATEIEDLIELVWAAAPESVALVLDDTHVLQGAVESWRTLERLLVELPANAHVVLSGRSAPGLAVGWLLAADTAMAIDEAALRFTDDELAAFGDQRGVDPALVAELPPWPALAALATAVGHSASSGYLWEEVLAGLPDDRRELFIRVAGFQVIDDVIVRALDADGPWSAERLLDGLPLVDTDRQGSFRVHSLWGEATTDALSDAERRIALDLGAEALLAGAEHRRAADAFAASGNIDGLQRAIRRFAAQPIANVSIPDVSAMFELLPASLRTAPIGLFLDAARHWASSQHQASLLFDRAMKAAERGGDVEVETLARWRLTQLRYLDDHSLLMIEPRMEELASSGVPLASSTPAFIRSVQAQNEGRIDDALRALDEFDGFDPDQRQTSVTARMIDLGRPEAVAGELESIAGGGGIDVFAAQALWLRGEIDAETGWAIAATLPDVAGRKGVVHEQASIRSVLATVAIAAGALSEARQLVDQAYGSMDLVGRQVKLMVLVADGLVRLATEGEDEACEVLRDALDLVPLGRFPVRAYLHGLTAMRALLPEAEVLDRCDLGPSLRVAVDAGRAVAVLRRCNDLGLAAALPWSSPDLLRCHVPPPLLTELALAATVGGDAGASALLERIPRCRVWLRRVAERHTGPVKAAAAASLASLPARPDFDLRITTLGRLVIERSDGVPVRAEWDNRERVRQLLVALLVRRFVPRHDLVGQLWPDLPDAKGAGNLRVNLHHLQQALQPDRASDAPPWFIHADGPNLVLAEEGVRLDVDEFDEQIVAAVRMEANGMPSSALAHYEAARRLYTGDFLPGFDGDDVAMERRRLRSVAHSAECRRGELLLARGEPEVAMQVAVEAERLDPISERAHRLFIRCHLALGSTSAARGAANHLLDVLADHVLEPEDETRLLLKRLQLPVDRQRAW